LHGDPHLLGSELVLARRRRGSVFSFSVQLGDPQWSCTRRRLAVRDACRRCVIVIDDEAAIREGMHELLSQWVAPAGGGLCRAASSCQRHNAVRSWCWQTTA